MALHPLRGAIFENLIYNELFKNNANNNYRFNIWFWRDNHGTEIDFLLESGTDMTAIEVKSSKNLHSEYLNNLRKFNKYNPDDKQMYLVYDGEIQRKKDEINVINWKKAAYLP